MYLTAWLQVFKKLGVEQIPRPIDSDDGLSLSFGALNERESRRFFGTGRPAAAAAGRPEGRKRRVSGRARAPQPLLLLQR